MKSYVCRWNLIRCNGIVVSYQDILTGTYSIWYFHIDFDANGPCLQPYHKTLKNPKCWSKIWIEYWFNFYSKVLNSGIIMYQAYKHLTRTLEIMVYDMIRYHTISYHIISCHVISYQFRKSVNSKFLTFSPRLWPPAALRAPSGPSNNKIQQIWLVIWYDMRISAVMTATPYKHRSLCENTK